MPYNLIMDILVAVLLIITIGYAVTLNKRLTRLRNDKNQLEQLARTFGESTFRAEGNIQQLRAVASALDQQMARAQSLRDDLAFLYERSNAAADRLEALIGEARDDLGAGPQPKRTAPDTPATPRPAPSARRQAEPDADTTRSEAERELLRALREAR